MAEESTSKIGSSDNVPDEVFVDDEKTEIRLMDRDFDEDKHVWEHQSWETAKHFQWFRTYRRLGGVRTLGKVAKINNVKLRTVKDVSLRDYWVYRTDEWDRYSDTIERQKEIHGIKLMKKRHIKLTKRMLETIRKRLSTLDPNDISPRDIPRWVDSAMKLERLARGVEQLMDQGNSKPAEDLAEKERLLQEIREKIEGAKNRAIEDVN